MHPDDRFQPASSEVLGKVIDGEAIVMNLTTGNYYSLEDTGAVIWEAIEAGRTVAEMERALSESFEVAPQVARNDLEELLQQLVAEGLIVRT